MRLPAAAIALSYSRRHLYRLIARGVIPPSAVKQMDGGVLIRRSWIENPDQWARFALFGGIAGGIRGGGFGLYLTVEDARAEAESGVWSWWRIVDLFTREIVAQSP